MKELVIAGCGCIALIAFSFFALAPDAQDESFQQEARTRGLTLIKHPVAADPAILEAVHRAAPDPSAITVDANARGHVIVDLVALYKPEITQYLEHAIYGASCRIEEDRVSGIFVRRRGLTEGPSAYLLNETPAQDIEMATAFCRLLLSRGAIPGAPEA